MNNHIVRKLGLSFMLFCASTMIAVAAWLSPVEQNNAVIADGLYGYRWEDRDVVGLSAANAIAVDAAGDIYTAGFRYDGSTVPADIVVTKRDAEGVVVWESVQDCPGLTPATVDCDDRAVASVFDDTNNVLYVLAASNKGPDTDQDFVVLKYASGSAIPVWVSSRYDNSNSLDTPRAMALSPSGDVYILGSSQSAGHTSTLPDRDVVTASIAASDGAISWSQTYEYQVGGDDRAVDLEIDGAGNVLVLINSTGVPTSDSINRMSVLKYDATGVLQWTFYNGDPVKFNLFKEHSSNADGNDLALDTAGNVYITGSIVGQNGRDVLALKLNGADGTVLADVSPFAVPGYSGYDLGGAITITADSVYVGALTGGVSNYDVVVLKFNLGLDYLLQSNTIDVGLDDGPGPGWSGAANATPGPAFLDVDAQGQVILAASVGDFRAHNLGLYVYDAGLSLLDSTDKPFSGDIFLSDAVIGADVHGQTMVFTAGHSMLTNTGDDEAVITVFSQMHPDLSAANLMAPAQWPIGAPIAIQADVVNLHQGVNGSLSDATGFTVEYALDDGLGGQVVLGSQPVLPLASGGVVNNTFNYMVSAVSGLYNLQINVDSLSEIAEQDEANNTISIPIEVFNPPDLELTTASGASPVTAGSTLAITYTIKNLRNVAAGAFDVVFTLEDIANGNIIDLTGVDAFTSLAPNAQLLDRQFVATVPQTTADGDYRLIVTADPVVDPVGAPNGQVLESDESNNSFISPATITVLPIPDLKVTNVTAGLGYQTGTAYTLDLTVFNDAPTGADIAPGFTTGVYLSADNQVTTADIRVGEVVSGVSLVAGSSANLTANINIPLSTAVGEYYLGAIADDTTPDVVTESNETNNMGVASTTSVIGSVADDRPDLVVTAMTSSLAGTAITFGASFDVTPTIENILPFSVPQTFSVGVYLSTDSQITTTDRRLGGTTITNTAENTWSRSPLIKGLTVTQTESQPITWVNVVKATVGANNLLTANATIAGTDGGATSGEVINGDGGVQMTVIETDKSRYIGLSTTANAANPDHNLMDYSIYIRGGVPGDLAIFESGSSKFAGPTFNSGDVLSVERVGSTVRYLQNGAVFYTSTAPSSGSLIADASFRAGFPGGGTIANGTVFNTLAPGDYYIGAIADDASQINEVVESNNSALLTGGNQVSVSAVVSAGNGQSGGGFTSLVELALLLVGLVASLLLSQRRCLI